MTYQVQPGDIFGRIGTGLAQGLSESVPKEIERARLSAGLRNFEQQSGELNPMQQLARLAGVPGITPQMIQSFAELARHQNKASAYGKSAEMQPRGIQNAPPSVAPNIQDVNFANLNQRPSGGQAPKIPSLPGQEQPVFNPQNPLNEEVLTKSQWTPQQRNARIREYVDQGFLVNDAERLAADDEQRQLAEPKAYQARSEELKKAREESEGELTKQLETKLQKNDKEFYSDVTGEMLQSLKRGMARDLRLNPNENVENVANKWSNIGLEMAKTKSQLQKLSSETGFSSLFKGGDIENKLKSYQKIFAKAGNEEELFNILKSNFGMSPRGAAHIAFPRSSEVKKYLENVKSNFFGGTRKGLNERKIAVEIGDLLRKNDSIQAILSDLMAADTTFDQTAFFDELLKNQDELSLSPRQEREIAEGPSGFLRNWGDFLILPARRR